MFQWVDYNGVSLLFLDGIENNVARLIHLESDFRLITNDATGFKEYIVDTKDLQEAKIIAEQKLKDYWQDVSHCLNGYLVALDAYPDEGNILKKNEEQNKGNVEDLIDELIDAKKELMEGKCPYWNQNKRPCAEYGDDCSQCEDNYFTNMKQALLDKYIMK